MRDVRKVNPASLSEKRVSGGSSEPESFYDNALSRASRVFDYGPSSLRKNTVTRLHIFDRNRAIRAHYECPGWETLIVVLGVGKLG